MKKEPPDVIYIGNNKKFESPLGKYVNLLIWATVNNDLYLMERVQKRILELIK